MFKVKNRNSKTRCEIYSKLTIKTLSLLSVSNICFSDKHGENSVCLMFISVQERECFSGVNRSDRNINHLFSLYSGIRLVKKGFEP